ncbi:MAG: glycosyltransferase [Chloroflexota bacterium]
MRIVLIGPVYPYRGGIAHHTTRLAQAILEEGHEMVVISFKRQYPRFLYPGKSDRDPSQNVTQVDAEFVLDPIYPWTWAKAIHRIRDFSPSVVVIQWWTTFWAPAFWWIAKKLRNICRVTFLIHNVVPHEAKFFDPWLSKLTLLQGNHYIVQSENQKTRLQKLIPLAEPIIIEHPVYDQFAYQRIEKTEARKLLKLPEDRPILLFFGIVRPYKGLKHLIDAMALVYQAGHNPLLVIAGEFWEDVEKYKAQIKFLGIENAIIIRNEYIPNEDVPLYFNAADVFVAPYVGGTQSGAVKIAMAFAMPIILSKEIFDMAKQEIMSDLIKSVDPENLEMFSAKIIDSLIEPRKKCDLITSNWLEVIRSFYIIQ